MASDLYESTKLMGAEVQLPIGEVVGRINDLIIDSSNGRIVFLVLDNVACRDDNLVAIPFDTLSSDTLSSHGGNTFVLNTTKEQVASAPSFNEFVDLRIPKRLEMFTDTSA